MKKINSVLIIVGCVLLSLLSGCIEQQKQSTDQPEEIPLDTKAEQYIENLTAGNYEKVYNSFTKDMKDALPIQNLEYLWKSLIDTYGILEQIVKSNISEVQGNQAVYVTCSFSKYGFLDIRFVFNEQEKIAGFQFVPTETEDQYERPDYVKNSKFTEENIVIGSSPWELPATLSIPTGVGPFPAVVLVHGSGPNDRDETIGPNKPFKDIAQGLASNGIMVLRYDKRTYAYPQQFANLTNYTLEEEVIFDALEAIYYVQHNSSANQSRIYLLGHSLGAMMAPEIARQAENLSGALLLAAPARSYEDLYLDQIMYLAELDGTISEQEQHQIDLVEQSVQKIKTLNISEDDPVLNLPLSYWRYLSTYKPVETAENLSIPLLILQGKRDYQVTYNDDFRIWNETFADEKNVTLRTYESLNHLFISGKGQPTNLEYLTPGNVNETVILDIVNWIKK